MGLMVKPKTNEAMIRFSDYRLNWADSRCCLFGYLVAFASTLAIGVLSCVGTVTARAAEACPNEIARSEQGAAGLALPDCRAYELVSPSGSVPALSSSDTVASANGQRFGYYSLEPYPGSDEEGLFLLASRSIEGWSVRNVIPPQGGVRNSDQIACKPSVFYSEELNYAVLSDGWETVDEGREQVCEGDDPPLIAGEPRGYANLFLRNNEAGTYQLLDSPLEGSPPADAVLLAGSSDLSHVVFADAAKLTVRAPAGSDLYEWSEAKDRLVTFLPNGEPVLGTLANGAVGSAPFTHAVSANGETVFFNADGNLYARLHTAHEPTASGACSSVEPENACTIQIDALAPSGAGPDGGGVFVDASDDGSRVFFTDEHKLTSDATAETDSPDLYEYNLETGTLTDLTVAPSGVANVLGFSGASSDGSYLYFVAKGVLAGGQVNSYGEAAEQARPNLYLRHAGVTTFIAALEGGSGGDQTDWQEDSSQQRNSGDLTTRVSGNGLYLAFNSVRQLDPEYDNEPIEAPDCRRGHCDEIYLYDVNENKLSCASCAPDGELPLGEVRVPSPEREMLTPESPMFLQHGVSDNGGVFFDTRSPLVPQATDGEVNVYEYKNGVVSLISSGTASGSSQFLDASVSGGDVFFSTGQGLVRSDTDDMGSVYDARVDGGFPGSSSEAERAPACESAEACQPPLNEAPALFSPASASVAAGGNLVGSPVPTTPAPTAETVARHSLTRAQKLTRALKACAKKPKRRRLSCETLAHKRSGTKSASRGERERLRRSRHKREEPSRSERSPGR